MKIASNNHLEEPKKIKYYYRGEKREKSLLANKRAATTIKFRATEKNGACPHIRQCTPLEGIPTPLKTSQMQPADTTKGVGIFYLFIYLQKTRICALIRKSL